MDFLLLASGDVAGSLSGAPLFSFASLMALLTLTALEIVLGIDNIVFIAILTGQLPKEKQGKTRTLGLLLAMGMRIGLLFAISWVMQLTAPLFDLPFVSDTVTDHATGETVQQAITISGKDLVLLIGGVFLIGKATWELHHQVTGHKEAKKSAAKATAGLILTQIVLLDVVFSIDSVITAVGMADHLTIMILAVMISVGIMLLAAGPVSRFVEAHPTLKILALSFLVLIGVLLVADGFHQHINRGYVYFAMAFAFIVDMLQLRVSSRNKAGASH